MKCKGFTEDCGDNRGAEEHPHEIEEPEIQDGLDLRVCEVRVALPHRQRAQAYR